jgi:Zn-finger nucleic acid-binding protein
MELRVLSESTVDTCSQCRGLWVDWFDGELVTVVKETAPLSFRPPGAPPASAACPRCTRPLTRETFAGVELLRCGECAGSFVPRNAFNALIDTGPHAQREDAPAEKRSAFQRLLLAIAKIFGAEPTTQVRIDE